jgi:hypothetical protein
MLWYTGGIMKRYCPSQLYSANGLMSGGIAVFGGGTTAVGMLAGVSGLLM